MPNIRPYAPADLPALRQCVVEQQDYERALDGRMLSGEAYADPYLEYLFDRCEQHAGTVFMAQADDAVVGFVAIQLRVPYEDLAQVEYDYAHISNLFVFEAHRGAGVGRALLEHARRHAVDNGASYLRIISLGGNTVTRRLYESSGFETREVAYEMRLGEGRPSSLET